MADDQHVCGAACMACPIEVRDLFATAYNALIAFEDVRQGYGDLSRAYRKLVDLRRSLQTMQPIIDTHFSNPAHAHPTPRSAVSGG